MKKIKSIGKLLTKEEQKAIKGGSGHCPNGPSGCSTSDNFRGYCSVPVYTNLCVCSLDQSIVCGSQY